MDRFIVRYLQTDKRSGGHYYCASGAVVDDFIMCSTTSEVYVSRLIKSVMALCAIR